MKEDFDAVVVGSGPNGLAAAITLQKAGLSVLVVESKNTIGGGLRTEALTRPGFMHDVCSAIHPMAVGSPFMSTLPLHEHGLEYIQPTLSAAHPFDDGTAALLDLSIDYTAKMLMQDEHTYLRMLGPMTRHWNDIAPAILGPLTIPKHPMSLATFGLHALQPSSWIAKRFSTKHAKGLWAGMCGHSMLPLSNLTSAAIGFVLMVAAHTKGWPIPKGGSMSIANAMASYFKSLGGKIETNFHVSSLGQLPSAKAVLFDIGPRQLLQIAGQSFSSFYRKQLSRYKYGMGVFKIDWALDGPVPFKAEACQLSGTLHLGGTFDEIAASEKAAWNGRHTDNPFVLFSQPSLFDLTRAPKDKHTAWAYCHVPNGSVLDRTEVIEKQIERFAPGFRDLILDKHTFNTQQLEEYNPNYIGGDINGGAIDLTQLFTRPALRMSPYRTSAKGIYICSSSTPPGGGVHGMCGYHAARRALRDVFSIHE